MKQELKNRVILLRKKGKTYQEIKDITNFNISKSTLSTWCKNIQLPSYYNIKIRQMNLENLKQARQKAILANKRKQEKICNELIAGNQFLINYINKDVCKLLLSILYLGEGSKHKGTRSLRLGSSSPLIVRLYLKLLNKCFPIIKEKFRITILCRADQNIKELEKFWESVTNSVTNIGKSQFYKTRIDKRTINKKTMKSDYKGVCVIDYFDTKIQLELELLSELIEKWL